jgi:hypothetical protein
MLKYVLDQANNMPNMKLRVNFATHNNHNTGVASGAAQGYLTRTEHRKQNQTIFIRRVSMS